MVELIRNLGALSSAGDVRLIVTGAQPAGLLFSVESLAQAVEFSLLGSADQDALAEELAAIENMSDEEIERLLQQSNG